MKNEMEIQFSALSQNESFARVSVAAFIAQLDPTMDELTEIKTVVSEAVTNAIIHGYEENPAGTVTITVHLDDDVVGISVRDEGGGIDDVDQAKEPLYTSKPDLERSGMGFTIMENFMDEMSVTSVAGRGTTVYVKKQLSKNKVVNH
ncbi:MULTISPECIES: anti-sigma F factor [Geomicrobium]|uniref:Anti-sigma F factor n=1 Tax=Geomicrobium sediminis TaxID=1347788 RepID=A0ABS2PDW7_9BACL|nr:MULTISPECIES: anti-sigma F factor [Geomicrobium]EZH67670.1 anti-sigma F factor [Bacillaceae bacterium JMAK1]MBM7633593.1 stage II sporulation protein AB (anti-sigma F factor) [Geomicrobium sediminis]GAJ98682.1 anti-sigma F factor [Geomicrobium sp. JCM 19055]GAK06590.1 anti-sigma F factor [Geomicrobium sp. JCM 19038]